MKKCRDSMASGGSSKCVRNFGNISPVLEDSSESEDETEPAKAFHRRLSTNREIKCSVCCVCSCKVRKSPALASLSDSKRSRRTADCGASARAAGAVSARSEADAIFACARETACGNPRIFWSPTTTARVRQPR